VKLLIDSLIDPLLHLIAVAAMVAALCYLASS
jgi:hypothetical protein